MTRLGILWPYLPAYRVAFCEQARLRLADHGIDLRVYTGRADNERSDECTADWHEHVPEVHLGRRVAARLRRLPRDIDLLIVEQAIKNLEVYQAVAAQHLGGPPIAMWGHGRSFSTPQGPARAALKQWLTRRSRWFFAYTRSGADHVVAHGFPATRVTVLNNTVDTRALRADVASVTPGELAEFTRVHELTPGRTAVFVGGVDLHKDIDFLLRSAEEARRLSPGFALLVAGTGDQSSDVQAQQRRSGAVRALGRLDGKPLAMALSRASIMMIPNAIGLVAVDALAAGLPVITRDNLSHGPEADYLVDGRSSLWLPADCSPLDYAKAAVGLLDDNEAQAAMRDHCLKNSQRYGLEAMVDAFVSGVLAWRDIEQAGL